MATCHIPVDIKKYFHAFLYLMVAKKLMGPMEGNNFYLYTAKEVKGALI